MSIRIQLILVGVVAAEAVIGVLHAVRVRAVEPFAVGALLGEHVRRVLRGVRRSEGVELELARLGVLGVDRVAHIVARAAELALAVVGRGDDAARAAEFASAY